jgi:hypothetical protein
MGKVAAEFDGMAANFADVAGLCDPEADAAAMVEASDERRRAWTNAAVFATKLDRSVPVLSAAAQLCGLPEAVSRDAGGRDGILLPLVCDPGELHRRKVWEAFAAKGRCGRWSALVALGARIRAADLEHFEPYRPPRPKQYRVTQDTTWGPKMGWVDPEDNPAQEPAPVTHRRRARALAR